MAKVLNPLNSSEARGKVGGLIYNSWRGISTVKAFSAPVRAKTAPQLVVMSFMTSISKAWGTLTAAQRLAWGTYADSHLKTDWTGNPVRVTAANAFSACSMLASLCLGTFTTVDDPPEIPSPGVSPATFVGGTGTLAITHATPTTADDYIDCRWRLGNSAGRNRSINEVKASKIFLSTAGATYTLDAAAVPGKATCFYRTINAPTGLAGPWTKQEVTVS